jgi:hypothetical protein
LKAKPLADLNGQGPDIRIGLKEKHGSGDSSPAIHKLLKTPLNGTIEIKCSRPLIQNNFEFAKKLLKTFGVFMHYLINNFYPFSFYWSTDPENMWTI